MAFRICPCCFSRSQQPSTSTDALKSSSGTSCGRTFKKLGASCSAVIQCIKDIAKKILAGFYSCIPFINRGLKLPENEDAARTLINNWVKNSKEDQLKIRGLEEPIPRSFVVHFGSTKIRPLIRPLVEKKEIKFAGGQTYQLNGFIKTVLVGVAPSLGARWDKADSQKPISIEGISVQEFRDFVTLIANMFKKSSSIDFNSYINKDNVFSLLKVARCLNIYSLKDACDKFLRNLIEDKDFLRQKNNTTLISQLYQYFSSDEFPQGELFRNLVSVSDISTALALVLSFKPSKLDLHSGIGEKFEITDEHMKLVGECKSLRSISFSMQRKISVEGFKHIRNLTNLEELNVSYSSFDDVNLEDIKKLTALKSLRLNNTKITKIEPIKGLDKLTFIDLMHTEISSEEFKHMGGWTALQEANLRKCHIQTKGIQILKQLPKLERLDLSECKQIGSAWFDVLKDFPALKFLQVMSTDITNDMIQPLSNLVTLQEIDVFGCNKIKKDDLGSWGQKIIRT